MLAHQYFTQKMIVTSWESWSRSKAVYVWLCRCRFVCLSKWTTTTAAAAKKRESERVKNLTTTENEKQRDGNKNNKKNYTIFYFLNFRFFNWMDLLNLNSGAAAAMENLSKNFVSQTIFCQNRMMVVGGRSVACFIIS